LTQYTQNALYLSDCPAFSALPPIRVRPRPTLLVLPARARQSVPLLTKFTEW